MPGAVFSAEDTTLQKQVRSLGNEVGEENPAG
jgi:hypothetical protein